MENASSDNLSTRSLLTSMSAEDVKHDSQAYQVLHWAFVALPILAGLDKFAHVLTDWQMYLAPQIGNILGPQTTLYIVGIIEVIAGIGVAIKPRLLAPVVAVWLWLIVANLLLLGAYYDIALRDLALSLGALSLWRLSQHFDAGQATRSEGAVQ